MKGVRMSGIIAATDFGSFARLPSNKPSELPQRPMRKLMRQLRKNCSVVAAKPTIQQKIRLKNSGMIIKQGISIAFRLRNLAFYYFRKIKRQLGKTRVTGPRANMKDDIDRKQKKPANENQMGSFSQFYYPSWKQRPPEYSPMKIDCMSLLLSIIGLRQTLIASLLRSVVKTTLPETSIYLLVSLILSTCCIYFSTVGAKFSSQFLRQLGQFLTFSGLSGCTFLIRNQAVLTKVSQCQLKLFLKQLSAASAAPWQANSPSTIRNRRSNLLQMSVLG